MVHPTKEANFVIATTVTSATTTGMTAPGTTIAGRVRTEAKMTSTISNTTIKPPWNGPKGGRHWVTTTTMASNNDEGGADNSEKSEDM